MTAALLSIGDEILRGEIVNTNATWLASEVELCGHAVTRIEVVGDDEQTIAETLVRLARAADVVVVTGGLGPTSDDVTAAAVSQAFELPLERNEQAYDELRRTLEARGKPFRKGHAKQADLPAGSTILSNAVGTAPGFLVEAHDAKLFFLPGVPREMKPMFEQFVAPRVRTAEGEHGYHVVLHTMGVGESWIAEELEGFDELHPDVTLGFRAKPGEVAVRVHARHTDPVLARQRVDEALETIRDRLGSWIYGEDDASLVQLAGRALRSRGYRLAVAESCTGGLIAHQLTVQPASDFFVGGAVTYANAAKTKILGVSEDTLRGHGAVSAEVAAEMAEGARRAFDCEVAISVTGIAGPSGATGDKPVGLVHWAVSHDEGTICEHRVFNGDRVQVQQQAAAAALDLLRRTIQNMNGSRVGG